MATNTFAQRQSRAIEQIERERKKLSQLLGAIHKSLATPSYPMSLVRKKLGTLCENLELYFRTKEDAGFFADITELDPRFSTLAEKLTIDHEAMLDEARAILVQANECADRIALRQDVQPAFQELSKHLMSHESE